MADWATRDAVENALEGWTDEQIACRAYAHTWRPGNVTLSNGIYTIVQRCTRCLNRRVQDMDQRGYPLGSWKMQYRDGYLLVNVGRVGADGRAALRLATLRNLSIREVED